MITRTDPHRCRHAARGTASGRADHEATRCFSTAALVGRCPDVAYHIEQQKSRQNGAEQDRETSSVHTKIVDVADIPKSFSMKFSLAQNFAQWNQPPDRWVPRFYGRDRRRRKALPTTDAELRLMAKAAIMGESNQPVMG
jgi:hypothetical protein